jgi:hypothetical protein
MAQVTRDTFNTQFNNAGGGYFPTNTTQAISSASVRAQAGTLKDSVFFLLDDAYSGAKGIAPGITTIAGLKAIVTTTLTAGGLYVLFRDSGAGNALRVYELVTGTDAESSPGIIRPTDYAATTNEKVWKLAVITAVPGDVVTPIWEWSAHANAAPVATSEGQTWITKGEYVDGEFVITDGTFLIAKAIGSNTVDPAGTEFWFK